MSVFRALYYAAMGKNIYDHEKARGKSTGNIVKEATLGLLAGVLIALGVLFFIVLSAIFYIHDRLNPEKSNDLVFFGKSFNTIDIIIFLIIFFIIECIIVKLVMMYNNSKKNTRIHRY